MRRVGTILFLAALLACKGRGNKDQQYKTEKIDRGGVTMTVTATGTLSAVTTVQIGSQVSGVISRLYADFNSRVHRGQLLAELDPTPFQAQVEQRQADVTKARVDAANAKINYQRQARLAAQGLAAQADVDTTKAQYDGAVAQVQQASAALSQAQTNLNYTKISSPIDGIVVDRAYDVGQTVAASFQAPTLFQIAQDLTKMQVQADVDQSDIGRIQVGQVARFTVDSYPDQEFRGKIAQIRLNATVSQNVVTYPVIVEVPNPDEKLRPKMTANVTIDVATVSDVLRVANAALRFKPENAGTATAERQPSSSSGGPSPEQRAAGMGERRPGFTGAAGVGGGRGGAQGRGQTIWLMAANNQLKPAQIRTGITDGHYTQILAGDVKEGDNVVIGLATSKVEGPPPPGAGGPMGGRGGGGRGVR
ncbi:MAG TPA: efflux RND transporter periplasmic adaptor subunit [Thermoanaerobaculia bacterium]|nr:efflux RND transporter periplasmic adaptor subunit [Thermoanaerobaculia bacterium]